MSALSSFELAFALSILVASIILIVFLLSDDEDDDDFPLDDYL